MMRWLGRSPTEPFQSPVQRWRWYHWLGLGLGLAGTAIAAIGVSLPFWPWPAIVDRALEQRLGVPVQIHRLTVDVLAGRISLEGLTIDNPPGFTTPYLAQVQSVQFAGSLIPWPGRGSQVEHLTIQGVKINLEQRLLSTNLSTVLARLGGSQPPQTVTIGQFALRDLAVQVRLTLWGRSPIHHRLTLPDLVQSNITTADLRDRLLRQAAQAAIATWRQRQTSPQHPSPPRQPGIQPQRQTTVR